MTDRIDPSRYHSQAFHDLERERLWPHVWLLVCHASAIAKPGDLLAFETSMLSIVVVRGDDNVVRAFHNACVHRGMRLYSPGYGEVHDRLRCRYHCWEYSLSGDLIRAPAIDPSSVEGVRLASLRCEERAGFIWVCADRDAPGLEEFLGDMLPVLESFSPQHLVIEADRSYPLACNWKTSADVHNEGYHLVPQHPELLEFVDIPGIIWQSLGLHSRFTIPFGVPSTGPFADRVGPRLAQIASSIGVDPSSYTRDRLRDEMDRLLREMASQRGITTASVDRLGDRFQLYVFPNVQLNFGAFELEIFRHRPHPDDPRRCFFDEQKFRRVAPGAQAPSRKHVTHDPSSPPSDSALGQDFAIVNDLQKGLGSPGLRELRLGPLEEAIALMHRGLTLFVGDSAC